MIADTATPEPSRGAQSTGSEATGNATPGIAPMGPGATGSGATVSGATVSGATVSGATVSGAAGQQAETIQLDHADIIDTGRFQAGSTTVNLYGIDGLSGEAADGLRSYLASTDGHMTCQTREGTESVCLMSDGTDVAQVALVNGAARTKPNAPDAYKEQEVAAQTARRGIWVNLPPPPETIVHPAVSNTATLVAGGKPFPLAGLDGLGQPYASQLQGYIAANGDSLSCSQQGMAETYICLLNDGTDVAKVALVNGAARVAPDAPDAYRVQQSEALNNHRGFWLNPPQDAMLAAQVAPQTQYAFVSGDEGVDGVSYVGGAPMAVIDGEAAFLVYGDALGWGYYDHWHHWHGAPDRYRAHMERYHPYGHGLRGYDHAEAFRHEAGYRPGPGYHNDAGYHNEAGFHHEEAMHQQATFNHQDAMRHDMAMHPAGARPGMTAAPAGHPGQMAGGFGRPAAAGGGFVHPGAMASAGGFHPGAPMPAMHAPPAVHASPVSMPGKHH